MATIYRKVYPVPMPEGAEIIMRRGQRLARWTDGNGNVKTAPLSADGKKIMHEAGCWYARYTDADGAGPPRLHRLPAMSRPPARCWPT